MESPKSGETVQDVLFEQLDKARAFYLGKTNSYKRRLFKLKRTAEILVWVGGGLLGLHAYGLLVPLMESIGFGNSESVLRTQPQAAPTVLVALGAAMGVSARKRGYLAAMVRSSLALSRVTSLATRAQARLAAAKTQEDKDSTALVLIEELNAVIGKEREDWGRDLVRDINASMPGGDKASQPAT